MAGGCACLFPRRPQVVRCFFFFFKLNLFGLDDFFFHPFLSALSSGREWNILMKPLLSSYHFDPLVFFPVYTLASRMKGFRVSPPRIKNCGLPSMNKQHHGGDQRRERQSKQRDEGKCINSNDMGLIYPLNYPDS